jgi:prevent-host-death family protein
MTRQRAVAELKRDFREVLDAAERGTETVVLRRGRPVARIGPYAQPAMPRPAEPGGLLAVIGLLADWDELEADVAEIMSARERTEDRPAPDF